MTRNESWNCSKSTTTGLAYTKSYLAERPKRKQAAQPRSGQEFNSNRMAETDPATDDLRLHGREH
jgi:hypothetical protein